MFRIISESETQYCITSSRMDHPSIGIKNALVHHFRQGRMRENCIYKFHLGRLAVHGDDKTLDELGDFGSNHMGAEKFSGFCVKNGFYESVGL